MHPTHRVAIWALCCVGARATAPAVCTLVVSVSDPDVDALLALMHPDFMVTDVTTDEPGVAHVTVDYFNATIERALVAERVKSTQAAGVAVGEVSEECLACDQCAADVAYEDLPICVCQDEWTWPCTEPHFGCDANQCVPQHTAYCVATQPYGECRPDPVLANSPMPVVFDPETGAFVFFCAPVCDEDPTGLVRLATSNPNPIEACLELVQAASCDLDLDSEPTSELFVHYLCPAACDTRSAMCQPLPAPSPPPAHPPLPPSPSPSPPPPSATVSGAIFWTRISIVSGAGVCVVGVSAAIAWLSYWRLRSSPGAGPGPARQPAAPRVITRVDQF
jgi:hypothetical protein